MSRWRIQAKPYKQGSVTRGSDANVFFVDNHGHPIRVDYVKSLEISIGPNTKAVELTLTLVGDIELDIEVDMAATTLKRDNG